MKTKKVIKDWRDLVGLESEHYYIKVDEDIGCGWIVPKDENSGRLTSYLSTHTFYGRVYKAYERLLRALGFDVKLISWD